MTRLPMFVEVMQSRENAPLAICQKLMALLFRRGIAPLPFGASLAEIRPVLASMRQRNTPPAIFVVNTFWAEELLLGLDKLMGPTPTLFFQREIFFSTTAAKLPDQGGAPTGNRSSIVLRRLTPRPMAIWAYGSKTSDAVAEKAAEGLARFLKDGDFERLLRFSPQNAAYERALSAAAQNFSKLKVVFEPEPAQPAETVAPASANNVAASSTSEAVEAFTGKLTAAPPGKNTLLHARGIHGALENMGLSSLLIILEMEKKSGQLVLTRTDEAACLYLCRGRVVDARIEGSAAPAASRRGAEAVYYALTWTAGPFDFTQRETTTEDKIKMPTTSLLMEAARRADESSLKPGDLMAE